MRSLTLFLTSNEVGSPHSTGKFYSPNSGIKSEDREALRDFEDAAFDRSWILCPPRIALSERYSFLLFEKVLI